MVENFLAPKRSQIFGLDIDDVAVRIVELSQRQDGSLCLERYAIERLKEHAVTDGSVNDIEAVGSAINAAASRVEGAARNAAVGIPAVSMTLKTLRLPSSLEEQALEAQVSVEATQQLPFALDEIGLDFFAFPAEEDDSSVQDVLVAAARKEKIDERVAAVDMSKYKVAVVDAESLALGYALQVTVPEMEADVGNIGYVYVGRDRIELSIFRNQRQIFSRAQIFGRQPLLSEIARAYNLSPDDAKLCREDPALRPADYTEAVLQPYFRYLASEVNRALQLFFASTHNSAVDLIVVGGLLENVPAFLGVFADALSVETRVANPFAGIPAAPHLDRNNLDAAAPELLVAFGLAVRGMGHGPGTRGGRKQAPAFPLINLLPHREARRATLRKQFTFWTGVVFAAAFGVALLGHAVISGITTSQESRNAFVAAETAKLDVKIGEIRRLDDDINALLARKRVIEDLQTDRSQAVILMDQLVRAVPPGMTLTSLKQAGPKVSVSGYAESSDLVSEFMVAIQNSSALEAPELVEIKSGDIKDKRVAQFQLNFLEKRQQHESLDEDTRGRKRSAARETLRSAIKSSAVKGDK